MSLGGGFGDFEDDDDADDNGSSYSFDGFENERDDDGNDDGGFNEDFSDQQQKRWHILMFKTVESLLFSKMICQHEKSLLNMLYNPSCSCLNKISSQSFGK